MAFFHEILGQSRPITILQSILRNQSIPNALLFMGTEGIGKRSTAMIFIQALFCCPDKRHVRGGDTKGEAEREIIEPCGGCLPCRKIQNGNHPDFRVIAPEQTFIKIDQIRVLQESIVFPPIEAAWKVILIDPADQMTMEAQNSLLKTIEEPPLYALFILVSAKSTLLAPTLLSRCQKILFSPLSLSQIESILMEKKGWIAAEARLVAAFSGDQLGEALSLNPSDAREMEEQYHALVMDATLSEYDTLFEAATTFSKDAETFEKTLYYLSAYFRDLLVLLAVPAGDSVDPSYLVFSWRKEELLRWSARVNPQEVAKLLADVTAIQQTLSRNINKQLALETLLMQMRDKLSPSPMTL